MTESSRDQILNQLRQALPESSSLPDLPSAGPWQTFEDVERRFAETLEAVGGRWARVDSVVQAADVLKEIPEWSSGEVRVSLVDGVGESTIDVDAIDDPHAFENVDFAVLPGRFGVAENGAVWVTDEGIRQRVLFFLPQHLAIIIPATEIVHNMHEAYERIEPARRAFSGFISGPSKTADIEQSLVIGAHGARSLTVIGVDGL